MQKKRVIIRECVQKEFEKYTNAMPDGRRVFKRNVAVKTNSLMDILMRGVRIQDLDISKKSLNKIVSSKKGRTRKKYFKKLTKGKLKYCTDRSAYYRNRPKFAKKAKQDLIRVWTMERRSI